MSNIRVTYSGLISFIIGIISVFTGLFFVLIITRRLSPDEFGTWALIGTMISYFLISEQIISFWSTRQIARKEDVGRTAISSSAVFAAGAIPFYLALVYFVSTTSNAPLEPMILGAILLPVFFISKSIEAINLGHKPHVVSYSLLMLEAVKIPAALGFVLLLDLGINGAIMATIVAYIARMALQLYFAKDKIKGKFHFEQLKRWIKLSWLSSYQQIGKFVINLDVLIYTIITGSVLGIAYYSASVTVSKLLEHSFRVTGALYPALLAKESFDHIHENFRLLLFLAIPLLGIAVIFSRPGLFALNPAYEPAYVVAIILSFRMFFLILRGNIEQILRGIDTVDVEKNPKFSKLLKSKLFQVTTIINIQYGLQIATVGLVLVIFTSYGSSELELVMWWSIALLAVEIPFLIYRWIEIQKFVKYSLPYLPLAKYAGATIVFVIVFSFTSSSLITYHISIYDFLPGVVLQLGICIGIYFGITYLTDPKTQNLFKAIINEIISKK